MIGRNGGGRMYVSRAVASSGGEVDGCRSDGEMGKGCRRRGRGSGRGASEKGRNWLTVSSLLWAASLDDGASGSGPRLVAAAYGSRGPDAENMTECAQETWPGRPAPHRL